MDEVTIKLQEDVEKLNKELAKCEKELREDIKKLNKAMADCEKDIDTLHSLVIAIASF